MRNVRHDQSVQRKIQMVSFFFFWPGSILSRLVKHTLSYASDKLQKGFAKPLHKYRSRAVKQFSCVVLNT